MPQKKVALVTGAGQGIGKAITLRLLRYGTAVVIAERDEEAGREAEAEYAQLGPVQFVQTDVSDEASVRHTVSTALERFGGLHALVNNAGIAEPSAVPIGPDVRVHCVSPGWIDVSEWKKRSARKPSRLRERDHAQHPAGRVGRPEDVAALIAFLLGDDAGLVTGQNFVIDGGMTRKMIYDD